MFGGQSTTPGLRTPQNLVEPRHSGAGSINELIMPDGEPALGAPGQPADRHAVGTTTQHSVASTTQDSLPPPVWRARYQRVVVAIDLIAALLGVGVGCIERFGGVGFGSSGLRLALALTVPVAWLCCAGLNRAYEARFLGAGTIEFERVGRAFLHLVALTAFAAYASKADLSRGFVLVALPSTLVLSVGGRYAARKVLHARRGAGHATIPVLAIGAVEEIAKFSDALRVSRYAGLEVAAACIAEDERVDEAGIEALTERGIARMGNVDSIRDAVLRSGARSVAVISHHISSEKLRWISWQLEGTDTDLIVLPGLTEVAGRRLNIQQVGGLPLLYVSEPEFHGMRRVLKAAFDRCAAALALLVLAPALLVIAGLVRLTSSGPALFVQTRVGKDGKTFRMVKFRSMSVDAEQLFVELASANEVVGGTLFKMRSDPRVTRVGRVLRRYSLDELPQLLNVLLGAMSLVGPRPPLPDEVATYGGEAHRRLLVKPGLTGLWQISGRSDLSWEESIRLDLRYVENWSLSLDTFVLWKTARAVFRGKGAY